MSPSARRTTRAKNATAHPGDAVPKQIKRTKEQLAAAKEAQKSAAKKKEVEKQRKLTKVAQAEDNIVLDMQAQEASEPRTRPSMKRPLKRTYAMLDVTVSDSEADGEGQSAMSDTGERSDNYAPSERSASESIDPASDSDGRVVEVPKKKRGRPSKKASVLNEIQMHRRHLDPILEEGGEQEVEEQDDVLMADAPEPHASHAVKSQGLPFKAG